LQNCCSMRNVMLIHGLGRTPFSLARLASVVRQRGFRPSFYGYSSTLESLPKIVCRLQRQLDRVQPEMILAHSLGGILTRFALPDSSACPKHVVMLGTPNQPPRLAKWFNLQWWFRCFARSCGTFLASGEAYERLPSLSCPVTIFAGTAGPRGKFSSFSDELNDGIVAVSESILYDQPDPILVPALHSFLMNHPMVLAKVQRLLATSPQANSNGGVDPYG
jgi:hypothetical protein